jgi:hypothetical protein
MPDMGHFLLGAGWLAVNRKAESAWRGRIWLASTDKDSGYIRTTENTGVVILKGDWAFKVQVSVKFSYLPGDPKANPPTQGTVEKLRIQAAGIVAESKNGRLKHYLKGYDTEVLQNLFQDLQAKLGPR